MTSKPNPTKKVWLRWTGTGVEYEGGTDGRPPVVMDAHSAKGPGPMETLLLSVAGCMAVDVQMILERSKVPLTGLAVEVEGERAPAHPKRYTRIHMTYLLEGPAREHEAKVQRAIDLSRDKFCSVLHSLRPDIDLEIEIRGI